MLPLPSPGNLDLVAIAVMALPRRSWFSFPLQYTNHFCLRKSVIICVSLNLAQLEAARGSRSRGAARDQVSDPARSISSEGGMSRRYLQPESHYHF